MVAGLDRLFVAAPISDDAGHALSTLIRQGAPGGLPGRVVPPANWHVTLRFLGSVDPVRRDRLTAALDQADLGQAFAIRWNGLGAFPKPHKATVLWVGASVGIEEFSDLARRVEEAALSAGFDAEDRAFRPHLTLSRVRPPRHVADLLDAVGSLGVSMTVDRIALYRSHLGSGGARYEELEVFPLG
jgi:2'-5' RNA ligase